MKFVVQHGLSSRTRAREIVDHIFGTYSERLAKFEPALAWTTDEQGNIAFVVMKKRIEVLVEVDDVEIRLDSELPLLMRPFESKVRNVLDNEVNSWLTKAKNGEI